jgi:hypothetical protein
MLILRKMRGGRLSVFNYEMNNTIAKANHVRAGTDETFEMQDVKAITNIVDTRTISEYTEVSYTVKNVT